MQDFRNLKVWQRAHQLALWTYRITANFPREETFGLRHSMRKTAVDIPALIAEAAAKGDDAETTRALAAAVALGSKLEYYALMAADLNFITEADYAPYVAEIVEVKKMLQGFKRSLRVRHE
jgi:four helix bundle protein